MSASPAASFRVITGDMLEPMQTSLTPEQQERVATAIVLRARRA